MDLWRRHRRPLAAVGILLAAVVVFVLVWFQPQKLFIDDTVDEPLPTAATAAATPGPQSPGAGASGRSAPPSPAGPTILARGRLHSGEHHTEGTATIYQLADGSRLLRLADLRTSNGPLVKVWLSAADGDASDGEIDDSRHLDLGGIKGNIGNANYPIPAAAELSQFRSAVIWCDRFSVSFGAAALEPA